MRQKQSELQDDELIAVILRAAARAEEYLAGKSLEEFLTDPQLQDALGACMLVMGQAAREVTEMLRNWTSHVPWIQLDELADWRLYGYRDERRTRQLWEFIQHWLPMIRASLQSSWSPAHLRL